jgi:hypothetical protein
MEVWQQFVNFLMHAGILGAVVSILSFFFSLSLQWINTPVIS